MTKNPELGGAVPRETGGGVLRDSGVAKVAIVRPKPERRTAMVPPGPRQAGRVTTADGLTEIERNTLPPGTDQRGVRRRRRGILGSKERVVRGAGARKERDNADISRERDSWPRQWLRPLRIADGDGVSGVYGAPEVKVNIRKAEAGRDIRAEVNFYSLHDLHRTLIELRPLSFQEGGSGAQSAPSRVRARPALLLGATKEVTTFVARDAELAILQQWHDSPELISVMLVHGSGGQGKTRLVRHFARLAGARSRPPRLWKHPPDQHAHRERADHRPAFSA